MVTQIIKLTKVNDIPVVRNVTVFTMVTNVKCKIRNNVFIVTKIIEVTR